MQVVGFDMLKGGTLRVGLGEDMSLSTTGAVLR